MSDGHGEERAAEGGTTPEEPPPTPPPAAEPARPRRASRRAMPWLAALLLLILAAAALSPFWAPQLTPLLPWGARPGVTAEEYGALAARVAALEKRPVPPPVDAAAIDSNIGALSRRVEQLETGINARLAEIEKRPAPPSIDVDTIKSAQSALVRRVDQLEVAASADRQTGAAVAGVKAELQQLGQRVSGIEAQSSSREAGAAGETRKLQQELSELRGAIAELAQRLPAIERQLRSQTGAERNEAALALLLLQMREAVEQARPFPAEFNAFKSLAGDPALSAAADPLGEAARNGIASRAVLTKRLAELAGQIAAATEPPGDGGWGFQMLARLRGLVTIRHVDGATQTGPEAAVSAAQSSLAGGDLAGSIAALDRLSGANAEAARPWLRMARERLAVEQALNHLQALLTARLGGSAAPPVAAPNSTPAEPPARTGAPS